MVGLHNHLYVRCEVTAVLTGLNVILIQQKSILIIQTDYFFFI